MHSGYVSVSTEEWERSLVKAGARIFEYLWRGIWVTSLQTRNLLWWNTKWGFH